jgi:hypothetical protein
VKSDKEIYGQGLSILHYIPCYINRYRVQRLVNKWCFKNWPGVLDNDELTEEEKFVHTHSMEKDNEEC